MGKCLGYYGAGDEISHQLDFSGHAPKLSETAKKQIIEALAIDYPEIKDCSERDQKAIAKWVINESER